MIEVREARLPANETAPGGLWVEYLLWSNDEMDARYGFRIPGRQHRLPNSPARIARLHDGRPPPVSKCGFAEVDPYPESEIPDAYRPNALFIELVLKPESAT